MRILVVEDEHSLNHVISKSLKVEGYQVDNCFNGEEALSYLDNAKYDVIISDIMMPLMDGIQLTQHIRDNLDNTPVLLLTALDSVTDRVRGLDAGADDYLIKPFALAELLARVRVLVRRKYDNQSDVLKIANLSLNTATRQVLRNDNKIELSAKEFSILEYMLRNQDIVLSREQLENHMWSYDYQGSSNIIDVYIRYLRKKIDDNYSPKLIHTIRGSGYVLRNKDE